VANFTDVPADAVSCAGKPSSAALPRTVGNGLLALLTGPSIGRQGTSVSFGRLPVYDHQHVLGQAPTRKPIENPTRTAAATGGGAKGPHPLREPGPV
jgi:hypothetical protein